ncbi:hypothetical protein [Limnochorda pilosa]|uniref:Uncharacterized protein n=1 Tax=Limnochorda pilosa TaxID=1555112 RepID=A0A0K2SNK4_LIMPI|nr:hypothetical protein [Limnochorda pilosa]BAS28685.1 hypothetical protein LIP_2856 [Limnochorda pilosa]
MKDALIKTESRGPVRRRLAPGAARPKAAGRLVLAALLILGLLGVGTAAAAAAASRPGDVPPPGFPDATGASGEIQAVFLNPAAAAGLPAASASFWAVVASPKQPGRPPGYTVALLDPGGRLAGGFVATLAGSEAVQPLSLSYAVAGRLGPVALGLRPVWTRVELAEGLWTLDAGIAWRLRAWASLGLAGLDLPIADGPGSDRPPARGLAGLTFTATPLTGTLLEGTQFSLGLSDPNLDAPDDSVARAGLRVPIGQRFRLSLGYEHDKRPGLAPRWTGGFAARAGSLRLDLTFQTDDVYRAGIEVGW